MVERSIWQLTKPDDKTIETLRQELRISRIMAQLLVNRGFETVTSARGFLECETTLSQETLPNPQLELAVSRIAQAIRARERILIYGDYDVDGITATALLKDLFEKLGGQVTYYIPCRQAEGYGLNQQAILQAKENGVALLVTVDCGISSIEEVNLARELGMDVVITDHHQPPELLPQALAIVNPKTAPDMLTWQDLAGVGVAYKLGAAVADSFSQKETAEVYLDLVALGTIADIVPLLGENRRLVKAGLSLISQGLRPGLGALIDVSGLTGQSISAENMAFALAPRLNACGRMSRAELGVELLLTQDHAAAIEMAAALDHHNRERQSIEGDIFEQALQIIAEEVDLEQDKIIILARPNWHPGVMGIVASRLVGKFTRPVVLIALDQHLGKGSARSVAGFHLYHALEAVKEFLISFGGHEMAAGLSIEASDIESFKKALRAWAEQQLTPQHLTPSLSIEAEVAWQEITPELISELSLLAPFGAGNPMPLLVLRGAQVLGCRGVGGNGAHLKCRIAHENTYFEGIAFKKGDLQADLTEGQRYDVVLTPEINVFRGQSNIQLNIRGFKPFQEPDNPFKPQPFLERLYAEGDIWLEDHGYGDILNKEEFFTKVVGVTYDDRQARIADLVDGQRVEVRREPNNVHDPYAVGVYDGAHQLGYLKAELARHLAPALDKGRTYEAFITQVTGRDKATLGLNLCLHKRSDDLAEPAVEQFKEMLLQQNPEAIEDAIRRAILGENAFHPVQLEALQHLQNGHNTLLVLGTGRGKSAVFQAMAAYLALLHKKVTVIIYPLRSLVNDQLQRLKATMGPLGLEVEAVNGALKPAEKDAIFKKMLMGRVDIILTTPEFLFYHLDKFILMSANLGLFVVDEAHHLSQGKRRGYKSLAACWRKLGVPLSLAVTATANDATAQKIVDVLECSRVVIEDLERANLHLVDRRQEKDKLAYLLELTAKRERMVVYVNSRKQAYQLACDLRLYYPPCRDEVAFYHGGLHSEDRHQLEQLFRQGDLRVMVTTSAFGEGIDIPDIQHVVLVHLCFSATEFNQLSGRAGRNQEDAFIHVLFGTKDRKLNELILENAAPSREVLGKVYLFLREKAQETTPLVLTNQEIAGCMQKRGLKHFREQTASASLSILEEMGLLLRELEGNKRHIHLAPPPPGKLDLTDSVRFLEGLGEWEAFCEFADYVLQAEHDKILSTINKPIYPQHTLELAT